MEERFWSEGQSLKTWKEIGTPVFYRSGSLRASNRLCAGTTQRSMPRPKSYVSRWQKTKLLWSRASSREQMDLMSNVRRFFMQIQGSVVVVTGASSGIGLVTAH